MKDLSKPQHSGEKKANLAETILIYIYLFFREEIYILNSVFYIYKQYIYTKAKIRKIIVSIIYAPKRIISVKKT